MCKSLQRWPYYMMPRTLEDPDGPEEPDVPRRLTGAQPASPFSRRRACPSLRAQPFLDFFRLDRRLCAAVVGRTGTA